jgi:osmoprotectant transport system ATP-binding protein
MTSRSSESANHIDFVGATVERGGRRIVGPLGFSVELGETVVLLGQSGSGKTTTLRLINALVEPDSGEVCVGGRSTAAWDGVQLRRSIGYVIQEVGLFPHLTVAQNIGLVPRLEGWEAARVASRTTELLELVGLAGDHLSNRLPHELSGGQRQRVGVARALAADPPVLLCDEPFGALDPVTRAELQGEFENLVGRLSKTVVFVTHDVREALRLGDRIILLDQGAVRFDGSPASFRQTDNPAVVTFRALL